MQAQPDTTGSDVAVGIIIVALILWGVRKWFLEGYTGTLPPKSSFAQWVDKQVGKIKLWVDKLVGKITLVVGISRLVVIQLVIWAIAAIVVLAVIIWAFRTVFG